MMRVGFTDSYEQSRLNIFNGTNHPAAPGASYLAIYIGSLPSSAGTGGTEATGTRPAITFGSPASDSNSKFYIANTASITTTLTNTSAAVVVGFGVWSAATGGTLLYIDRFMQPFSVSAGQSVTLPINAVKVYSTGK